MRRQSTHFPFLQFLSVAVLALSPAGVHGQTVTMPAGGLIPNADLANGDSVLLTANPSVTNDLSVIEDVSWTNAASRAVENMIWQSTSPGTQVSVGLRALDLSSPPNPNPQYTLEIKTLGLQDVAMQVTSLNPSNQGSVLFDFRSVNPGDPVQITMDASSVNLSVAPLWLSDSLMTLHSQTGTNTVSQLSGNRSPIALDVDSGTSLTFHGCGQLGAASDSDRLNFNQQGNSGDVDNGILDVDRSHVIFAGNIRAHNGGEGGSQGPKVCSTFASGMANRQTLSSIQGRSPWEEAAPHSLQKR